MISYVEREFAVCQSVLDYVVFLHLEDVVPRSLSEKSVGLADAEKAFPYQVACAVELAGLS